MTNFLWKILPNPTLLRLSRLRGNVLTKRKEESQERRCALTQLRVSNPRVLRRTLRIVRSAKLIRSSKSIEKLFLSAVTLVNSTMPTECAKIVITPRGALSWQQSVSTKTVPYTPRASARIATWASITKRRETARRFQMRRSQMLQRSSPPKPPIE